MAQASSSATKRPRRDTSTDDNRAECPFSVRIVGPREKELKTKSKKRRKRGHNSSGTGSHLDDDDLGGRKILNQCAPFAPKGAFDTHSTMDVHYVVEPAKQWADMTRYNSFVLNNVKYYCEGFIYVANESSIERQKGAAAPAPSAATIAPNTASTTTASTAAPTNGTAAEDGSVGVGNTAGPTASAGRDPRKRSEDDWVARILEIRASDEHHVYARVFWMYWPDELPAGTHYGKRQVQGRQPYHGASELIASNHSKSREFSAKNNRDTRADETSGHHQCRQRHFNGISEPTHRRQRRRRAKRTVLETGPRRAQHGAFGMLT